MPLVYRPGELAEVDFFEVLIDLLGDRKKAWLFVMRLMYSGRDFAWVYERQDQVSFFDAHVRAFAHFGAVPQRLAYDNLKSAVRRMLVGAERELTERFTALSSHYLFEPCFCRPATGHDKGGVEARGKAIRWQELVPIPAGESLLVINERLLTRLDAHQSEIRTDGDGHTIGERFAEERGSMLPLPERPFLARRTHYVEVSRRSLVTVEGVVYSVPSDWTGLTIVAHVGATHVELVNPRSEHGERIVVQPRKRFGERSVDYRHYVRELSRKPQAVRQVAPELVRDLGEPFGAAWRLLVDVHGPKEASRVFAKILSFVEKRGITNVAHAINKALQRGEPLLLALAPPPPRAPSLAEEKLPHDLGSLDVPAGRAADYDQWLMSFFATLECERLDRNRFRTQAEARMALFQFIEGWYNPHRLHSGLGICRPSNSNVVVRIAAHGASIDIAPNDELTRRARGGKPPSSSQKTKINVNKNSMKNRS